MTPDYTDYAKWAGQFSYSVSTTVAASTVTVVPVTDGHGTDVLKCYNYYSTRVSSVKPRWPRRRGREFTTQLLGQLLGFSSVIALAGVHCSN